MICLQYAAGFSTRRCPPRNRDGDAAAAVSVGQQLVAADPEHAGPLAGLDELSGGCVDPVKAGDRAEVVAGLGG